MKIRKKILTFIVVLVVGFILASFFFPQEVIVERQLLIKSSSEAVYEQVVDLKKWDAWSPWHNIDPNMKKEWGVGTEGLGANYSWKSDHHNVGNGQMEITLANAYERIETHMEFEGQGAAEGWYIFEDTKDGVLVTWGFKTSAETFDPLGRFFNLFTDYRVGGDFETGLHNLKLVVEK